MLYQSIDVLFSEEGYMVNLKPHSVQIEIDTPLAAPHWALLERQLLDAQTAACQEFYAKYFDERGYLRCVPRWGGDDGPDDAAENLLNWTMLHALGAPDVVLDLYKQGWEGHLRQYTEAKTVEVPFARDGMYYKEFPVMFDWFHHGEGYSAFFLQGLSDPYDPLFQQRTRRYAAMYMGEDPQADNYDPEHKVIKSMINGSRGPMLRKATGLDWAGDPIEIEGRFHLGHGERNFEEMIAHFKDYNDVVGDNPLNLGATTLGFNGYAFSAETKYKEWLLEYVDAWVERTEANGGIIPTNIGLDGTIGGACDGKWYGGVYGWGFTVVVPQTGALAHRNYQARTPYGFANALLLTGDQRYVDVWRGVIDKVNENARVIDGQKVYPQMYGDEGWYHYTPDPFNAGVLELYYWSMKAEDRDRVVGNRWVAYLHGEDPDYPVDALQAGLDQVRRRVAGMRQDTTTPDTRLSDDMNRLNPAITEALTELMLGGLPTGRVGYPLHCRLRYFDPAPGHGRAGLPEDVAALVEEMTADRVTVTLVNLSPVQERTVVVQGGAYGEHQFTGVTVNGDVWPLAWPASPSFLVRLAPGCGARLRIEMERYANPPTLAFPWDRD
jgi:hypothetical protein